MEMGAYSGEHGSYSTSLLITIHNPSQVHLLQIGDQEYLQRQIHFYSNCVKFVVSPQVSSEWVSKEFTLVPYQTLGGRQTCVLGGIEDLLASLEDGITTLVTIKNSKHVAPIKVWRKIITLSFVG